MNVVMMEHEKHGVMACMTDAQVAFNLMNGWRKVERQRAVARAIKEDLPVLDDMEQKYIEIFGRPPRRNMKRETMLRLVRKYSGR